MGSRAHTRPARPPTGQERALPARLDISRAELVVALVGVLAALAGAVVLGSFFDVAGARQTTDSPEVMPEVPVTAMDEAVGPSNNSPILAADPTEPRFVVVANRLDAPDFSCSLHVSGDGGRSWVPAAPVTQLPDGAEKCYAPEVAFDAEGRLYYLFVGLRGRGNEPMGTFISSSPDRGRTFSAPRQVLGPLNFGVRMAIDQSLGERGRLHLVWLQATSDPPLGGFGSPPNPILAAYSDDGGSTFSTPVQVSDASRERVVAPALVLGRDHAVHVGYYDLQGDARDYYGLEGPVWEGTWSLVVATSLDRGRSFGPGRVVDDSIVPAERVMLIFTMPPATVVAQGRGRLCAAWTDARHGDPDIFVRCSANGGELWEEPRRLNDDGVGNGRRQYLPRMSVSSGGRLDLIFFDRRGDRQNVRNDVFYTFSPDGGRHFARNQKLTRISSDSRVGQQYVGAAAAGQFEFGSRLGLLSKDEGVLAAWPDTRHSAPASTGQNLFVVDVHLRSDGQRQWSQGAGVVLVAVGASAVVAVTLRWRARRAGAAT